MTDPKETKDHVREGFMLIADELDSLRDRIDNANLPVLQGIGEVLRKLDALTEDRDAIGAEVKDLRKQVADLRRAQVGAL